MPTQFYAAVANGQSVLAAHDAGKAMLAVSGLASQDLPTLACGALTPELLSWLPLPGEDARARMAHKPAARPSSSATVRDSALAQAIAGSSMCDRVAVVRWGAGLLGSHRCCTGVVR
jgi:hypothetical protein